MSIHTILLVTSDKSFRETLRDQLQINNEFLVLEEQISPSDLMLIQDVAIDLIILDISLINADKRKATEKFRKDKFSKTPIVILTDQNDNVNKILNLEEGANDYVMKPFRFSILLARIRAQLRQHKSDINSATITIGPYVFQPRHKLLTDQSGEKIYLTEKEVAILCYLYNAKQKVIARDILLEKVWGYNSHVTTHTLETHVYRLRKKIERNDAHTEIIITENGGYKIIS